MDTLMEKIYEEVKQTNEIMKNLKEIKDILKEHEDHFENLESKIKSEMEERKTEISKIKGLNEYDKLVLKNVESRISILEEESQNYTIN